MGGCQIQEWLATFNFIPRIDDHDNYIPSDTTINYDSYYQDPQPEESETSTHPSVLVGAEDDLLVPTQCDIDQLYHRGKATWKAFVIEADGLRHAQCPSVFGNPYILLGHVPCLPAKVPNVRVLSGHGSADGTLYVEADNDGEHIRFQLANGEKYKTRPENWEGRITEDGIYFLYTHKDGWQVWTDDLIGYAVTLSKGKNKRRKGKHGGSSWKKWLA